MTESAQLWSEELTLPGGDEWKSRQILGGGEDADVFAVFFRGGEALFAVVVQPHFGSYLTCTHCLDPEEVWTMLDERVCIGCGNPWPLNLGFALGPPDRGKLQEALTRDVPNLDLLTQELLVALLSSYFKGEYHPS